MAVTTRLSIENKTGEDTSVTSSVSRVNPQATDANLLAFAQQYNSLQDGSLGTVKLTTTRDVE